MALVYGGLFSKHTILIGDKANAHPIFANILASNQLSSSNDLREEIIAFQADAFALEA